MLLAPHRLSTAAGLLKLAAGWLVLVLMLQGLAAAHWLGSGPLHRHKPQEASVAAAVLRNVHASPSETDDTHAHALAERHRHDLNDASVSPADDPQGLDPVGFALTAALALMALGVAWLPGRADGRIWRAAPGWAARSGWLALPFRPPRAC